MRPKFNRFVERHEIAWELAMGALAIVYVVIGFVADDALGGSGLPLADLTLTGVFAAEFVLR